MLPAFFKQLKDYVMNVEVNKKLLALMREYAIPTVGYAIIENYQILNANTLSLDNEILVNDQSIFQACSLSKSLTAYAILLLVFQGDVDLDKPINDQLTTWKIPGGVNAEKVNIRHCLNMTSGLSFGFPPVSVATYSQEDLIPTLDEILLGKSPALNPPISLLDKPGANCFYSGAGYMVLQKLISEKSNHLFYKYMRDHVLLPLGMTNSTFECPLSADKIAYAIPGYTVAGIMEKGGWNNIVTAASGGLWSTPVDLAKFILHLTHVYLGKHNDYLLVNLATEMLTQQENTPFGLGIVVDGNGQSFNFRKNGHNTSYHCEFIMFPFTGQGMVVMTNSFEGFSLIEKFINYVAMRNNWPDFTGNFNELEISTRYTTLANKK